MRETDERYSLLTNVDLPAVRREAMYGTGNIAVMHARMQILNSENSVLVLVVELPYSCTRTALRAAMAMYGTGTVHAPPFMPPFSSACTQGEGSTAVWGVGRRITCGKNFVIDPVISNNLILNILVFHAYAR